MSGFSCPTSRHTCGGAYTPAAETLCGPRRGTEVCHQVFFCPRGQRAGCWCPVAYWLLSGPGPFLRSCSVRCLLAVADDVSRGRSGCLATGGTVVGGTRYAEPWWVVCKPVLVFAEWYSRQEGWGPQTTEVRVPAGAAVLRSVVFKILVRSSNQSLSR